MKVLIIRFSSIGDIVMTTPVIRCLQRQTSAIVHVVTKASFATVYQDNPYISKLHLFDDSWDQLVKELRSEKFDHVIDLHNNLRSIKLCIALGKRAPRLNKLSLRKALLIYTGINTLPDLHVSERGMKTLRQWSVEKDGKGMDYFVSQNAQESVKLTPGSYACLALGTAHATKNMPLDLMKSIIKASPIPLVLLGGPSEKKAGAILSEEFPEKTKNLAGKISLDESAAFLEKSHFLIAGDTGILHMAAALKRPTISIWGATIPEYGVFPYYGKIGVPYFIQQVKLPCRPCSKHGSNTCPKGHFNCMNLQDLSSIILNMNELNALPYKSYQELS